MSDTIAPQIPVVKPIPGPLEIRGTSEIPRFGAALGIYAKLRTPPPPSIDRWDILCLGGNLDAWTPDTPTASRLHRFALQSVARHVLPHSRVSRCLRCRTSDADRVTVTHSKSRERAQYGGLQTCGSVWACPVCAAKISERRRIELKRLLDRHLQTGGDVLMITRTFPHTRFDSLGDSLAKFQDAEQRFKKSKQYKKAFQFLGLVGSVKALEVTYGSNGWHPHAHEIVLTREKITPVTHAELLANLFIRWQRYCVKAGLPAPSAAYGLTIQKADQAAAYASKWGIENELTKWHQKKGKKDSVTPFDLLRVPLFSQSPEACASASALFEEYTREFKGKAQLRFSRGLKDLYDIEEMSDEEIAAKPDEDAAFLGWINPDEWRLIVNAGKRGLLLEKLSSGDWSVFEHFIRHLKTAPPTGTDERMPACARRTVAGGSPSLANPPKQKKINEHYQYRPDKGLSRT